MDKETKGLKEKVISKLREYRYVLLVLLAGLVLLLLPTGGGEGETEPETDVPAPTQEPLEERLESILSLIDGAGEVRVLLTLTDDGERVLAGDSRSSTETTGQGGRSEEQDSTVTVSKGGGVTGEVEVSYRYPSYRGAVIAAQGADSAAVRLELMEAVRAATGLSADAIKIVKMAENPQG